MIKPFVLYAQRQSPYCRKVLIMAFETGLINSIIVDEQPTSPAIDNLAMFALNPLGKVPILQHGETTILDSKHICHYLDKFHDHKSIYATDKLSRNLIRNFEIIADGISDAAILVKQARERAPTEWQSSRFTKGQLDKINRSLSFFETSPDFFETDTHIGHFAFASAIAWLKFAEIPSTLFKHERTLSWFNTFEHRRSMVESCLEGSTDDGFILEGLLREARLKAI